MANGVLKELGTAKKEEFLCVDSEGTQWIATTSGSITYHQSQFSKTNRNAILFVRYSIFVLATVRTDHVHHIKLSTLMPRFRYAHFGVCIPIRYSFSFAQSNFLY